MRHVRTFVRAEVRTPIGTPGRADEFLRRAVAAAGMSVIGGPHSVMGVYPENEGVSSTAILDFSSTNLHEWPDHPDHRPLSLIHFDLYTCGAPPEESAIRALFEELGVVTYLSRTVDLDEFLGAR